MFLHCCVWFKIDLFDKLNSLHDIHVVSGVISSCDRDQVTACKNFKTGDQARKLTENKTSFFKKQIKILVLDIASDLARNLVFSWI